MAKGQTQNRRLSILLAMMFMTLALVVFGTNYLNDQGNAFSMLKLEGADDKKKLKFVMREFTYMSKKDTDFSTTVVSTYIELNKSKHSVDRYNQWTSNFAKSVRSPLVMFVNQVAFEKLSLLRKNLTTKFYIVNDSWSLLQGIEMERNKNYTLNYRETQHGIDPEKRIHNPNLYIIWNSKSFLLYKIAQLNPFGSTFFLYSDAGAFRHGVFDKWPDTKFIKKELAPKLNNSILLGQINMGGSLPGVRAIMEGTFYGGSAEAVTRFYTNFFKIHDEMFDRGLFIGKDQNMMERLAFGQFNNSVVRLQTWKLNCSYGFDEWFFYQNYFSRNPRDRCGRDRLASLILPGRLNLEEK